jgi:26S proteasome regulatory subunit N1
VIQNEED